MIDKKITKIVSFLLTIILSTLPFNFILGSKTAFFSYSSMVVPALGYQSSLFYVILYIFTKGFLYCNVSSLYFFHRLPLLFAALALKSRSWITYILVPVFMMLLFLLHPVGQEVFYYSWYWFIPIIIYCIGSDTIYSRACAASFIAHAIGSVIWLYYGSIPVIVWNSLIPIVAIERSIIAVGMIFFVRLFGSIYRYSLKKISKKVATI